MVKARVEAVIKGHVQGVGFRMFACRQARAMGLTGYVHNEYDGNVLVVAQGGEDILKLFLQSLKKGPAFSDVKDVNVIWGKAEEAFTGFDIR